MFFASLSAITSIKLAKVVDFPLPVAPVTRTSPRFNSVKLTTASGIESSFGVGTS